MNGAPAVSAPRRPLVWYVTTAASLAVALVPIWLLVQKFGVSRKIIVGYGFLAYILGVTVIKLPLHHFVIEGALRPRLHVRSLSAVHGLVSALSELGATIPFFVFVVPHLTFWQLVGFGVGAGALEAIMLPFMSNPLKGTKLEEHAADVFSASAGVWSVQSLSILERVWAMLLQLSARGLVFIALTTASLLPAVVAVGAFGLVDGSAYYWHMKKWRFDSLHALARIHIFLGVVAILLTIAFVAWSEQLRGAAG